MIRQFLNFVDIATDFGNKSISAAELLRMFGVARNLSEAQIATLRNKLEAKGVL